MKRNKSHLSYCLNIHPGESRKANIQAIWDYATEVKKQICPDEPFGLGLRIGAEAAAEWNHERLAEFKTDLEARGLYAFTINGFPYGVFHGERVKEQVYAPDWQSDERREYTIHLCNILVELLPEETEGSISTVPGSYKPWITHDDQKVVMAENIRAVARHLALLEKETGKYIHLGLEPEPCCFLETTDEFISFYNDYILVEGEEENIRRYIGICFDCCHLALQYEDLASALRKLRSENILISKIHLSAALKVPGDVAVESLKAFNEPVYFHQVKSRMKDGTIQTVSDLPEILPTLPHSDIEEMRVHFHVPLNWEGEGNLQSTRDSMDSEFWKLIQSDISPHMEIETYTFDVFPEVIRDQSITSQIASEFRWVFSSFH